MKKELCVYGAQINITDKYGHQYLPNLLFMTQYGQVYRERVGYSNEFTMVLL